MKKRGNKKTVDKYDNAIALIKIFAIVNIVLVHFSEWTGHIFPFFFFSGYMVPLFVVGSGFGITYLYLKYHSKFGKLIKHQLVKIYLGLGLGTLAVLLGIALKGGYYQWRLYYIQPLIVALGGYAEELRWLYNYILVLFGNGFVITAYPTTNGSLWFISLIIGLYLLFPLLYLSMKKINVYALLAITFIIGTLVSLSAPFANKFIVYNVFFFIFGIFIAKHHREFIESISRKYHILAIIVASVLVFVSSYYFKLVQYTVPLFLFLFLYVIFNNKYLQNLGWVKKTPAIVFILYIIHAPFIGVFKFLLWKVQYGFWLNLGLFMIYFIIMIVISIILTRIYEEILKNYNDY